MLTVEREKRTALTRYRVTLRSGSLTKHGTTIYEEDPVRKMVSRLLLSLERLLLLRKGSWGSERKGHVLGAVYTYHIFERPPCTFRHF